MATKSLVPAAKDNFLKLKCSDCLHFKGPQSPHYPDKCSKIGVQGFAKACRHYTPDLTRIRREDDSTELLAAVANAAKKLTDSQIRMIAFLLVKQGPLKKFGLRIGQPLYINLPPYLGMPRERRLTLEKMDLNYLDQWYKGYIIGAIEAAEGAYEIYISPSKGGKPDPYTITLKLTDKLPSYVLTWRDFKIKKHELEKKGRKKLPPAIRKKVSAVLEAPFKQKSTADDVPTIDTVPSAWLDHRPGLPSLKFDRKGKTKLHKIERDMIETKSKNAKLKVGKKGRVVMNG